MISEDMQSNRAELERLSRQLIVRGWTFDGQRRFQKARISVHPALTLAALYLRAAGATVETNNSPPGNDLDYRIDYEGARLSGTSASKRLIVCRDDGGLTDEINAEEHFTVPNDLSARSSVSLLPESQLFAALLVMKDFLSSPV